MKKQLETLRRDKKLIMNSSYIVYLYNTNISFCEMQLFINVTAEST